MINARKLSAICTTRKTVVHIKTLKLTLDYELILEKVPYIEKAIHRHKHRIEKKAKNDFEKRSFKVNEQLFSLKGYGEFKESQSDFVSEPNCHKTKHFSEKLLAIEMNKVNVKMTKPVYLGLLILDKVRVLV